MYRMMYKKKYRCSPLQLTPRLHLCCSMFIITMISFMLNPLYLCTTILHTVIMQISLLFQVSQSGSKYLLTTSFPAISLNSDLSLQSNIYRFRPLNLEAPPINLTPPLCYYRDGPSPEQVHALVLYELPLRQVVGCDKAKQMKIRPSLSKQNVYFSCGNWSVWSWSVRNLMKNQSFSILVDRITWSFICVLVI